MGKFKTWPLDISNYLCSHGLSVETGAGLGKKFDCATPGGGGVSPVLPGGLSVVGISIGTPYPIYIRNK